VGRIPGGGLPVGFKILDSFEASSDQADAIGMRLGGKIDKLFNILISVHGSHLQVNTIACPNAAETQKIYKSILARKGHPAFCHTFDRTVVEFVGDDTAVAIVAGFELGYKAKPKRATYKISFEAAGIEQGDYMLWNRLFNLFLESNKDPDNVAYKTRIGILAEKFRFRDEIVLRSIGPSGSKPAYSFKPEPIEAAPMLGGDLTRYKFQDLPKKAGVPYVSISATIGTSESTDSQSTRKPGPQLLEPTEFWPSDDPQILNLAKRISAGCQTEQQKILALLKWLRPGLNVRFAGPVVGSRYGVKKTLSQKFGYCWDFSDCFVTLARALKIPSRQVAGWLYGQSGHIWAEVYFNNKEWRYVDPTGGGIVGCGIYHIPYLTSEDGEMPILYLSQPQIEFLNY
ncbi:MAG: transglutaminase-like domain-containing protein, partial [Planctomycetota bacterium]